MAATKSTPDLEILREEGEVVVSSSQRSRDYACMSEEKGVNRCSWISEYDEWDEFH